MEQNQILYQPITFLLWNVREKLDIFLKRSRLGINKVFFNMNLNNQLKSVPLYYQFNILPGTVLVNYLIMELVMINAVSLKQIVLHRGIKNKSEI